MITDAPARRELPEWIRDETELEELLSRPGAELVRSITALASPLVILGAAGKMGPTLARMARRAADLAGHPLEIIAVSRFGAAQTRGALEQQGIQTLVCDLLEPAGGLPDAPNVLYLVGLKFGTAGNPAMTWVTNTVVPARVAERYRNSRLVALSTGNVYPATHINQGGSREQDPLTPLGEYANATVGRERVFEFYSRRQGTPIALLRLFYAVELRYGVLVDLAQKVFTGESIELANGYFNCIWQGDANDLILRAFSLAASPPSVWNLCHPEVFSVRAVAMEFGRLLGRAPNFAGRESATALLGNSELLCETLGRPATPRERMMRWIADWVKDGRRSLGRPTHFETRDGNY